MTTTRDLIQRLAEELDYLNRLCNVPNQSASIDEAHAYLDQLTDQITLEKALELVDFEFIEGAWRVKHVRCDVWGDVKWDVFGNVHGTINGRKWQFVETPREKLKRLIDEGADKDQLIEVINQLENSQ